MARYDLSDNCPRGERHPDACNIAHKRLALEATMVRGLIRNLKAEGWKAVSVYTDMHEAVQTETQAMDCVFSVDESTVTFERDGERYGVLCVLGNGPDVFADYNMGSDAWNEVADRITMELYERHEQDAY